MKTYQEFVTEAVPAAIALGMRAAPYVMRAIPAIGNFARTAGAAAATAGGVLVSRRQQQGNANQGPRGSGQTARPVTPARQKAPDLSVDARLRRQHAEDRRAAAVQRRAERTISAGEKVLGEIQKEKRDADYAAAGREKNRQAGQEALRRRQQEERRADQRRRMENAARQRGLD